MPTHESPMSLLNRQIMVTGASSGIGRETCILLSELGARVFLVARHQETLEETRAAMASANHIVLPFDLNDVEAIPSWLVEVTAQYGPLNGLVHSAAIQRAKSVREFDDLAVQETMRINFNAAFSLIRGFRQKQVRSDQTSIVLVSSIAGLIGVAGNSAYSASKGALIAATKSLALELSRLDIRINCVAPGLVNTDMLSEFRKKLSKDQYEHIVSLHPLGLGQPRDVANAIAFLLADTSRWITGTTLVVDGGYTAQ
jgi:NAD(P)-dependent dehydrogenase (short-subunit alcohol dehydrogenase family)